MADKDDFRPDGALWVVLKGVDGRCFVMGNPHTHQGRMAAWSEALASPYYFSKSDVLAASEESLAWIEGFLAGSESGPHRLFGPGAHDASDDDPRLEYWRDAAASYRRTGDWPFDLEWRRLVPFPPGVVLPAAPAWTLRGARSGRGTARRGSDRSRCSPGTERSSRGRGVSADGHDPVTVTTVHDVCRRCGFTDDRKVPDPFTRPSGSWRSTTMSQR